MGRLVNPDEFVSTNVEKFVERASSPYAVLLDSTPVFVTYYHQNRIFTTNDVGLENVEDDLGRDSPILYDKIEKVPVYGIDNLSMNFERGDMGYNTNIENDLTMLPNVIKPYPNDYFYFDDIGERFLFKVTEVQEDMIKSKPYYKVTYKFSKYVDESTSSHIEEQVKDEYVVPFNNIGTDNICVLKKSTYQIIDAVHKLTDKLIDVYSKYFYNKMYDIMLLHLRSIGMDFYNQYLNKFLIDNSILQLSNRQKDFYRTIHLLEYIPDDPVFDITYEKTLYYAVETQNTEQLKGRFFSYMDITYAHVPWKRANLDYKNVILLWHDDEEVLEDTGKVFEYIDKEFYGRIILNNPYVNEKDYYMENFIIRHINGDNSLPTEEFLDMLNTQIWRNDMRAYIFIPLLIYILRFKVRHEEVTIQYI